MVKAISMTGVLVVKMKDVAELAGVSSAAVSRYLNGGYISADKAERIKKAIELTGYVRSSQARALRTGFTKLIGVIVPKINSESVSRITAGIGQVLGRRGYQMLLANTDNAAELATMPLVPPPASVSPRCKAQGASLESERHTATKSCTSLTFVESTMRSAGRPRSTAFSAL